MDSRFSSIVPKPLMEVFTIRQSYNDDTDERKVDLGIGAYRNEEGQPWVLPVVAKTELQMANDKSLNHEYLMFLGLDSFYEAATKLMLGEDSEAIRTGRAFGIQSLSGAGAIRLGAEFLSRVMNYKTVYISNPTWDDHLRAFTLGGIADVRDYRYWDAANLTLDFAGLMEDLSRAPKDSVVVLHPCAHNPTGCDPTREQWVKIADLMQERKLFPFFDSAYQGFASGDLDEDAWPVRYFVERGFELFCAQSFAKNLGLYNERAGNLTVVLRDEQDVHRIRSHMMHLIRGMYCSPPNHGARIVATILKDPQLFQEWQECILIMSKRTLEMRKALRERLESLGTPGTWDHITQQIGMFSYTGMTVQQVEFLIKEKHIYLMKNGRVNLCGLTAKNLDYVANAIREAVMTIPKQEEVEEQEASSHCVTL